MKLIAFLKKIISQWKLKRVAKIIAKFNDEQWCGERKINWENVKAIVVNSKTYNDLKSYVAPEEFNKYKFVISEYVANNEVMVIEKQKEDPNEQGIAFSSQPYVPVS